MSLLYHPKQGAIVICDFKGFVPPEMVKRRPAVIVSPRMRKREGLCTIVPLSTTLKCSPKIGQLVKLAKTLKPSSQHEAEAQKIQPRV